ncbi:MAG: glycoside hydrolase family 30 beta sandwich domain-containing protein [Spirochaetaceae bacterium]|nr:glycoside hydrolase family 30 beta sandwich domain-containing protein [Spirochaetaceae bacterium]
MDSRNEETAAGLHHLAAVNPDGSLVCVAMNESDDQMAVSWDIDGRKYGFDLPAHSIATGILTSVGDSAG